MDTTKAPEEAAETTAALEAHPTRPELERAIQISDAATPGPWKVDPISHCYVRVPGEMIRGTGRIDDSIFIAHAGNHLGQIARYALAMESKVEELEKALRKIATGKYEYTACVDASRKALAPPKG